MKKTRGQFSCSSPEHYTPEPYAVAVHYVLGGPRVFAQHPSLARLRAGKVQIAEVARSGIHLDPASSRIAAQALRAGHFFSERGEERDWVVPGDDGVVAAECVYCNPPGDPRGVLVPAFWRRCVEHTSQPGYAVLWAGYAYASRARLDTLANCPGPSDYPTVTIAPGAPCTTSGGRMCWISGETGQPGKAPGHANYFTLLGGDDGQRARFRDLFGAWGRYSAPSRPPRDLVAEILTAVATGRITSKNELVRVVRARKKAVLECLEQLLGNQQITRVNSVYAVPGPGTDILSQSEAEGP